MDIHNPDAQPGLLVKKSFVLDYLTFIMLGALFLTVLAMGALSPMFIHLANLRNIMVSYGVYIMLAFAVVLTVRAAGPDLSVAAYGGLAAAVAGVCISGGMGLLPACLIALLICMAVGAVSGVVVAFVPLPRFLVAIVTTFIMRFIISALARLISGGNPVVIKPSFLTTGPIFFLLVLLAAGIAVGCYLWVQFGKGKRLPVLSAYSISAGIGALAGIYLMVRIHAAVPSLGFGYLYYLLFVFGAFASSRILKNSLFAMLYVAAVALVQATLSNVLNLLGINVYVQQITAIFITVPFLVFAIINVVRDWPKKKIKE